jgi:mono/diheme cytochrome c family protein
MTRRSLSRARAPLLALCAAAFSIATVAAEIELPQGPGVNLVYAECRTCHDLQYVRDAKGLLPAQWKAVIASMRDYGYTPNADTEATLLAYLNAYLGSGPPPAAALAGTTANAAPGAAAASASGAPADGRTVYAQNCVSCHGADGRGQPGYFPPLAGNPDIAADRLLPVLVLLHGLSGSIDVAGKTYASSMPPFDHLSDVEIAAVVTYVQSAWGNTAPAGGAIDAATVAAQRSRALTAADVRAYRVRAR